MTFRRKSFKILLTKNAFQILFCQRIVFHIFNTIVEFLRECLKKNHALFLTD